MRACAAQRILWIKGVADCFESHAMRVDEQQAANQSLAEANNLAYDFKRHHRADNAGKRAENACLFAGRDFACLRRRRK
jgi:hypothetical protein